MGKRSNADVTEVDVEDAEEKTVKKNKKDKKDKKKSRTEETDANEEEHVVEPETEVVESAVDSKETVEFKKITEDDLQSMKPLYKKWLKESKDIEIDDMAEEDSLKRFKKFVKKYNKRKLSEEYYVVTLVPAKPQYEPAPTTGDISILLFYAYCPFPMTRSEQDAAIAFCYKTLNSLGMTGRLRCAREGYNATLTGTSSTVRQFTAALRTFSHPTFGATDFKYVDGLPDQQMLKGLKVWPVTEIVTYGFEAKDAPLHKGGVHLAPADFHEAMLDDNTVVIDVRNYNESLIGKFSPPPLTVVKADGTTTVTSKVLDPCMRRSTEFPQWVKDHHDDLKDKKVLMYCTAGVRCERASAFLKMEGINQVFQLDGGIHRYLEAYPEDGGFWVGKNYVFDKRFNHGAAQAETISFCVYCEKPWDRYQAQKKCGKCSMEVLLCKDCQKIKPNIPRYKLICPLCK